MRFLSFLLAPILALALSACTASQTACNTMDSLKISFDEFALEGEFSASTIRYVNAAYDEGEKFCAAPAGYDQAAVIAAATRVALLIRREMKRSDVAYRVMGPQLDKLEAILRQARQAN